MNDPQYEMTRTSSRALLCLRQSTHSHADATYTFQNRPTQRIGQNSGIILGKIIDAYSEKLHFLVLSATQHHPLSVLLREHCAICYLGVNTDFASFCVSNSAYNDKDDHDDRGDHDDHEDHQNDGKMMAIVGRLETGSHRSHLYRPRLPTIRRC